jgi:hypothetical protein
MLRRTTSSPTGFSILILAGALVLAAGAAAEPGPSSDLLLPYFEVDLSGFALSTVFHLTNSSDEGLAIAMTVHSNWGIPLLEIPLALDPEETRAFNLRDWLLFGQLPDGRTLGEEELAHVQAALSGLPSPRDDHYYASAVRPGVAVGYVTIRVQGFPRQAALWGNYFTIDPNGDRAEGDVLVDIDQAKSCGRGLCMRHRLFFLEGAAFDGGTQLIVWTGRRGTPSLDAAAYPSLGGFEAKARDMNGELMGERHDDLLATTTISVADLALPQTFGTLDLISMGADGVTPMESFIGIRYSAEGRYSVGLQTFCQSIPVGSPETPEIRLEKATNGEDADVPTGPVLPVGSPVTWTYRVSNTGDVDLSDVTVEDDKLGPIACPQTALAPGETMTCTAHGTAEPGQYRNEGWTRGTAPDGQVVEDHDPSHYFGDQDEPGIDLEKATNGDDADTPTGPVIPVGDVVTWTYQVTNTGDVVLSNVTVTDDRIGAIVCPRTALAPGESMLCTAQGIAEAGQYANLGTVTGTAPDGQTVADEDPSHYFGEEVVGGSEGCTPGYWKNHTDSWPLTGYSPGQSAESVFAQAAAYPAIASASLLEALDFPGGPGTEGAARNLMRAAVAGLLDASHPGVDYPRTPAEVIAEVDAALASGDRGTMLGLASGIDSDNNLGCPLN